VSRLQSAIESLIAEMSKRLRNFKDTETRYRNLQGAIAFILSMNFNTGIDEFSRFNVAIMPVRAEVRAS